VGQQPHQASGFPAPGSASPGQQLLWQVADEVAALTLPPATVRRLGAAVDELLDRGWTRQRLLTALTVDTDGLAHPRSVLAWRIDDLLATPVPSAPQPAGPLPARADHGVHRECPGDDGLCGRPLPAGEQLCSTCRRATP
jgi:hypothetical protein